MKTLQEVLETEFDGQTEAIITKVFKTISNLIMREDIDLQEDSSKKLTVLKKRVVQYSWQKIKRFPFETSGPLVYKFMFEKFPHAIELFPFKDQKNFLQSAIVKKQTAGVIGVIGRAIEQLDEFEKVLSILTALGVEHRERMISRQHYDYIKHGLFETIKFVDGARWDPTVKRAWEITYHIITQRMLMMTEYDPFQDIEMDLIPSNTVDKHENEDYSGRDVTTMRPMNQTQVDTIHKTAKSVFSKRDDESKQLKSFYIQHFSKEVDFHHKVAYRFEKAYRLGKKMQAKKQTLNLEVIDCIGEHSNYIEQDHMALFYLLFFCIYYNNAELVDFVRSLIQRIPPVKKIDQLLEYMDVNGIEKIRTIGE